MLTSTDHTTGAPTPLLFPLFLTTSLINIFINYLHLKKRWACCFHLIFKYEFAKYLLLWLDRRILIKPDDITSSKLIGFLEIGLIIINSISWFKNFNLHLQVVPILPSIPATHIIIMAHSYRPTYFNNNTFNTKTV